MALRYMAVCPTAKTNSLGGQSWFCLISGMPMAAATIRANGAVTPSLLETIAASVAGGPEALLLCWPFAPRQHAYS